MSISAERDLLIEKLARFPRQLLELTADLSAEQLTTRYLPQEWTVAQNVHHVADSHLNSYLRCKLMLTEDHPTLTPYDQDVWADLPDAQSPDLTSSFALLTGLHVRWVVFWQSLPAAAWQRTAFHPENGDVNLAGQLIYYAAHGEAHIDQITRTLAAGSIHR